MRIVEWVFAISLAVDLIAVFLKVDIFLVLRCFEVEWLLLDTSSSKVSVATDSHSVGRRRVAFFFDRIIDMVNIEIGMSFIRVETMYSWN